MGISDAALISSDDDERCCRERCRCLDHGHRAALPPLLIAVVDRHLIPSGVTSDTNELTHNDLPTVRNNYEEINLRFCYAAATQYSANEFNK